MATYEWQPIERLREDWSARCRGPAPAEALERLAAAEPAIAQLGAGDLGELVDMLSSRRKRTCRPLAGPLSPRDAAAVVQAMLRSAGAHPLVARALLQALLPGIVGVCRRLGWGSGGDWRDGGAFLADALTTAWEVVVEWSGQDRAYAVLDILSAVRCRLRRQLVRQRDDRARCLADAEESGVDAESATVAFTELDDLARAIEDRWGRELATSDAAILYAQRILGYTLAELSGLTGRSRRRLREQRDRAARALVA